MSGGRVGAYELSAEYLAQLRSAAELAEARRRWRRARAENTRLVSQLAGLKKDTGRRQTRPQGLVEPSEQSTENLNGAAEKAQAANERLRAQIVVEARAACDRAAENEVGKLAEVLERAPRPAPEPDPLPDRAKRREREGGAAVAAKLLARIDAGAPVSPLARQLAAELQLNSAAGASAVTGARFRDEVKRINTLYRRRTAEQGLLEDASAVVEETADAALVAELAVAEARFGHGDEIDRQRLDACVDAARERADQLRRDELARQRLVRVFEDLGLLAEDRFKVAVPAGTTLVRRAGFARHAIEVEVSGSEVRLTPVHLVSASAPRQGAAEAGAAEGPAADREYCADIQRVLDEVARHGLTVKAGPGAAPGQTPPRRLVVPDGLISDELIDDTWQAVNKKRLSQ